MATVHCVRVKGEGSSVGSNEHQSAEMFSHVCEKIRAPAAETPHQHLVGRAAAALTGLTHSSLSEPHS